MAFGWLKNLFGKKNKGGNAGPIESVYENPFYESGDNEAVNPFYQEEEDTMPARDSGASMYNSAAPVHEAAAPAPEAAAERREAVIEPGNLLENIGGMPTRASIDKMAGGLKMEKIGRHKKVAKALDALDTYHTIMQASHEIRMNLGKMNRTNRWTNEHLDTDGIEAAAAAALDAMKTFIQNADDVVKNAGGFFASRSSNVQKIAPVFANLLVQAYGLLPKLVNLDHDVAPYIMATDAETFTFADIMSHDVTAGKSAGLALKGTEDENGAILLKPEEALSAVRNGNMLNALEQLRRDKTTQARMNLKIPALPVGVLKAQRLECADEEQVGKLHESAARIADDYISELSPLLTALEDTKEAYDAYKTEVGQRLDVHKKEAEYFRISRLLYRVTQSKEQLVNIILRGISEEHDAQASGYQDLLKLSSFAGSTLASAAAFLNEEAMDETSFARLVDAEGKELQEGTDYIVGGGKASISILDFKNQRVLRAEKKEEKFLSKEEQKVALSGIRDEAVGKVSQFLGFQVAAQAEAVGFQAKNKGESGENAVFGGSIMEMAKGTTASKINLMMGDGQEDKLGSKRRGEGYHNLNVMKQGRMIGDIMKMNVMDYIVLHRDRNMGNYMVNLDAAANESMITAIDNDKVLGDVNNAGRNMGGDNSIEALIGINNRSFMDFGNKLETAFPMMTQEVKDAIQKIDLEALNQLLMPYSDRVSRMAAVHRAAELKEWAGKVPTCDLSTEEGTEAFVKMASKETMQAWLRVNCLNGLNGFAGIRFVPNTLIRMILDAYGVGKFMFGTAGDFTHAMRILGFSKEEATELFLNNLAESVDSDQLVTKEQLAASDFGKELEKYDN